MADGRQVKLHLYQGASGPVAYDAIGRCWPTRKDGDHVVPVGLAEPWVMVTIFAEGKKGP